MRTFASAFRQPHPFAAASFQRKRPPQNFCMSTPYLKLRIAEITRETEDAVTLHLEHPGGVVIPARPGQFLTLILPFQDEKVRRSYSLSSCTAEGPRLSVTVKRVAGGLVSNYLLDKAQAGQELEALAPIGNFTLETNPQNQRHVVLLGAGSGISPLFAILKAALCEEPQTQVLLIYGNRNEDNIIFKTQLEAVQQQYGPRLQVIPVLSQPKNRGAFEHTGRLNRSKIIRLLEKTGVANYLDTLYFTCGPEGFMEEVKEALKILRIPQDRVLRESFVSKQTAEPDAGEVTLAGEDPTQAYEVQVNYEGAEYQFTVAPNQTILEAALKKGIDLPYSCQSGLCTACRGKCLSGKVHLDESEGLSDAELKEGYVLCCVGHPVTPGVSIEIG